MSELIEVEVYDQTDPTVIVDVLPQAIGTSVMRELKGPGAGNTNILINDPKVISNPALLNYRNVLKVKVGGRVVEAFTISKKSTAIIDDDASKEVYAVSGETLRTWFNDAIVYPEGGLRATSYEDRFFNFSSIDRSGWYDADQWSAPTNVVAWGDIDGSPWRYAPAQWPDAPNAQWIWSGSGYSQAAGDNFFRYEFTASAAAKYSFFFAADDTFEAYVDGQLVSSSNPDSVSWSTVTQVDVNLDTGSHVFAVRVNNVVSGPAALIAAILTYGDPAAPTSAQMVSYTGDGTSGWKVAGYPDPVPGWSPGEILLTLMGEATDRGVRFPGWLTPTFTGTIDSNGATWPRDLDWSFSVGDSLADVISQMEELVCDLWIDPDTLELNMVIKRGVDRTVYGLAVDGVTVNREILTFEKGKNLLASGIDGVAHLTNSLIISSTDGWTSAQDDETSIGVYGVIESKLETGVSAVVSAAVADVVFTQKALPEEGATYSVVDIPGYTPIDDYDIGDWVFAPDELGASTKRRVMSISFEPDGAGNASWSVEFDTIFQDNGTELSKWLTKMGGGALGGQFANSGGGSSIPVGVPTIPPAGGAIIKIPVAPTDLAASSVGLWSTNGVDAYSEVTLTWNAVTTNTDGSATVPFVYEVWGHLTSNSDNTYQRFGTTADTTLTVRPFQAGSEWTFKVRAFNGINSPGEYSSSIDHTMVAPTIPMDPPTTPTVSSNKGVYIITWDGKLNHSGTPQDPPPQFRYVYAMVKDGTGGTYARVGATLARDGRTLQISDLTVGHDYYAELFAVDGMGITSSASAAAHIALTGIDLGDLGSSVSDAIDAAQQAAVESTGVIDNSFEVNPIVDWTLETADVTTGTSDPRTGARALQIKAESSTYVASRYNHLIRVDDNDSFYVSAWVRALGSGSTVDGGIMLSVEYGVDDAHVTSISDINDSADSLGATYVQMAGVWVAPSGTRVMRPVIRVIDTTNTNQYVVDDVIVRRQANSTTIEDDAIVTSKISAGAVVAASMATNSIAAASIQAGAIIAGKIAAGTITANEVAAHTLTGDVIAAGTIKTLNLSSEVGSELDISSNSSVNIIVGQISDVNDDLNSTNSNLATMQTYYTFGPDGAVISSPGSPFSVAIKNDRIQMLQLGVEVSSWTAGQMFVNSLVGTEVILGNHKLEKYGTGTVVRAL